MIRPTWGKGALLSLLGISAVGNVASDLPDTGTTTANNQAAIVVVFKPIAPTPTAPMIRRGQNRVRVTRNESVLNLDDRSHYATFRAKGSTSAKRPHSTVDVIGSSPVGPTQCSMFKPLSCRL